MVLEQHVRDQAKQLIVLNKVATGTITQNSLHTLNPTNAHKTHREIVHS